MDNRPNLFILCGLLGPGVSSEKTRYQFSGAFRHPAFSWRELVSTAAQHCVLTALHHPLVNSGLIADLEPELADYLEALHALNIARNMKLRHAMSILAETFDTAGIDFAFLKGGALLLHDTHPTPGTRFMRDIDVLVEPSGFDEATRLLRKAGYRIEHHPGMHDMIQANDGSGQIVIEMHQAVLPDRYASLVPAEMVLERKIPVPGLSHAFTACAEDMLVHNVAHALLHDDYYRLAEVPLRDAQDFLLIAESFSSDIDWTNLSARFDRADFGCVLTFYANSIHQLFASGSIPCRNEGLASLLTRFRWTLRRGRPLDITAAHTGLRNIFELPWRFLVLPPDRARILANATSPRRYPRSAKQLFELGRRSPGRFS